MKTEYYTTQDIADLLGVTISSIQRYVRDNKIPKPVKRINPQSPYRFRKDVVDRWMAED